MQLSYFRSKNIPVSNLQNVGCLNRLTKYDHSLHSDGERTYCSYENNQQDALYRLIYYTN